MSRIKTALVTGAALRIGASIAGTLHERGLNVILHYHSSRQPAADLANRLNQVRPDSAGIVQADLSDADSVERLVAEVKARINSLDVLVNNASRFYPTEVGASSIGQWEDLLNSNVRGPYFLAQGLLEELRAANGSIINLVDVHAERPMDGHAVYCISKAGMAMMTRSLANELGPDIRVNGVSPGAILWPDQEPGEQEKNAILDRTALGRLGETSDISSAVAYLALDAPYVTGQILAVDGGRSLNI